MLFLLLVTVVGGVFGGSCGGGNYSHDVYTVTKNTELIIDMYDNLTFFDFICTNSVGISIYFYDANRLDMASNVVVAGDTCYAQNNTFANISWTVAPYMFGIECSSITTNCIVNVSQSISCLPNCTNKNCGSDGCFKECGSCSGSDQCIDSMCTCIPVCTLGICGNDGCGGQCPCQSQSPQKHGSGKDQNGKYSSRQKAKNTAIGLSVFGSVLGLIIIALIIMKLRKQRVASNNDSGELQNVK